MTLLAATIALALAGLAVTSGRRTRPGGAR